MTATYDLIASNVLGSTTTTVTFSSIPATYRDLILVAEVLGSGGNAGTRIQFNGDTGSNYPQVEMSGNGTTASSGAPTLAYINGQTGTTTARGLTILQVMDYSATDKHKTSLSRYGRADSATAAGASRWANTAAINQITIFAPVNTYAIGSTFYLYGIVS